MKLSAYQKQAHKTSKYSDQARALMGGEWNVHFARVMAVGAIYAGLTEEVAEIGRMVNRQVRDHQPIDRAKLAVELGDVLWFVAELATEHGLDLDEIALTNIAKLASRAQRNVISGQGDDR